MTSKNGSSKSVVRNRGNENGPGFHRWIENILYFDPEIDVPIDRMLPHFKNPRFGNKIALKGKPLTLDEIKKEFEHRPHTQKIYHSIKHHGGPYSPPLVERSGDHYVVRDGNDRWFVLQLLHQEDPQRWDRVFCELIPDHMPEEHRKGALMVLHNIGAEDWPPEARIAFAIDNREKGVSNETISKLAGYSNVTDFLRDEQAYKICQRYMKEMRDKTSYWSHWQCIIKRAGKAVNKVATILENDQVRKQVFQSIRDGKLGTPHDARMMYRVMQNGQALKVLGMTKGSNALEIAHEVCEARKDVTDACFDNMAKTVKSIASKRDQVVQRLRLRNSKDLITLQAITKEIWRVCRRSHVGVELVSHVLLDDLLQQKKKFESKKKSK